jgi:polar amino acid transport system substrate-binding protein
MDVAVEMLSSRKLDAFATNKGILFEMADKLPGAKVLDGRWGTERHSIAIPKGREDVPGFQQRI